METLTEALPHAPSLTTAFVHSIAVSSVCSSPSGWGAEVESKDKCPLYLPL